ncbi:hypothetical protein BD310DRAFT_946134 [Dichomitus squalens]|uniref:Uncharacterized protein n=1 Tax=Dichomitus squalens TaxID=114155 RepID=A0A4Q9Q422_9APHY|nr:hypothetical protein BD310DRAFT_946134 [Dichomitus squalens]
MSQASSCVQNRKSRCLTASQIAKDSGRFEQWSQYHHLVVGSYHTDIPVHLKQDVEDVFSNFRRLPESWINKDSATYARLQKDLGREFLAFLQSAQDSSPSLFSPKAKRKESQQLLRELQNVFLAFQKLEKLRDSEKSWTEADYAAQVYNVLRATVGLLSDNRAHCPISLPQPLNEHVVTKKAALNLNARTIRPDGSLFVPRHELAELSESEKSPFNVLAQRRNANNSASHGGASSFKWQSTLCSKLPAQPGFEVASCFWEDKKPEQKELEVAYRQNRMATTAALRQLHALKVEAPIFGLVWAEGTVRAHVDWYKEEDGRFTIVSAPYPGPPSKQPVRRKQLFHSWNLADPGHIIEVYLLLRKLDRWTVTGFRDRVVAGIWSLVDEVEKHDGKVVQWRRRSSLGKEVGRTDEREYEPESISSPAKPRARGKAAKQAKRRTTRGAV